VLADDWKNINEPRIEKSFPEHPCFTLIRSPKDPTKNYQGTFHAKLMLLKFPTFLRYKKISLKKYVALSGHCEYALYICFIILYGD
jgi:hypothetical protein